MSASIAIIAASVAVVIVAAVFRTGRNPSRSGHSSSDHDSSAYGPALTDSTGRWNSYGSDTLMSTNDRATDICVTDGDQSGYDGNSDSCSSDSGGDDSSGGSSD